MNNTLYMLASEGYAQMNSFIITTKDGKVIVIDGGWRHDAAKLLARLREITGDELPHVDAWFHSHAHADHTEAFMEILSNHRDALTVGGVYFHFPSVQYFERFESGSAYTLREFYELLPRFADKARIVSEGDRYEVGEAVFDILYTADPAFSMNAVNNSSTVFRMTLGGKSVIFLGDLGIEAGRKLLARCGDGLKSDWCQMAHHGQSGVERAVYEAISPEGCLWSTPEWLWNNDAGQGYNTHIWQTVTVRGWMEELGAVHHLVTKDGDRALTF